MPTTLAAAYFQNGDSHLFHLTPKAFITPSSMTAKAQKMIATFCVATMHGRFLTEHGRFLTERGRFLTERGRFLTERGRFSTERGRFLTERGRFSTVHGRFLTEHGRFLTVHGHFSIIVSFKISAFFVKKRSKSVKFGLNSSNLTDFRQFAPNSCNEQLSINNYQ